MDIEKLTKSQIVLLTLLVSFVTSIATGIVTVSLVEQAPPAITQSVSRIVRETVQSAIPATVSQPAAALGDPRPVKPTPTPTPPSLSQLIAGADRSIVRLYGGDKDNPTFLGLGILLDSSGTVVTDYEAIGTQEHASATFSNGSSSPMTVVTRDTTHDLAYLTPSSTTTAELYPASFATSDSQVGDTVVAFAGKNDLRIASGLVVASGEGPQKLIETNTPSGSIIKGSPLINAQGQFLGISTGVSRAVDPSAFMPTSETASHSAQIQ